MKAISAVIATVLILIITVGLVSVAYMWTSGMFGTLTEEQTEYTESLIKKGQASFEIDTLTISKIYIRNTGQTELSEFSIYVNGNSVGFKSNKGILPIGEVVTLIPDTELKSGDIVKITTAQGAEIEKTLVTSEEAEVLGPSGGGGSGTIIIEGSTLSVCGNGAVGVDEECDDGDLINGDGCDSECKKETPPCGNGKIDVGESCDGDNLNEKTCIDLEYDTGTLACDSACEFNTDSCFYLVYPRDAERLDNGNTLIVDNTGVKEFDYDKNLVWSYDTVYPDPQYPTLTINKYPQSVQRLDNGNTLISIYGNLQSDGSVIEINPSGDIVWSYDTELNRPYYAERLDNGNTLITDGADSKIIEVDSGGDIVWSYSGVSGNPNAPQEAHRLSNGNTLVSDTGNNKVSEVSPSRTIIWYYTGGLSSYPISAKRLDNGNTLVTFYQKNYVYEVTPTKAVVWSYPQKSVDAEKLSSGNILIASGTDVKEIDYNTKQVVWTLNQYH